MPNPINPRPFGRGFFFAFGIGGQAPAKQLAAALRR
jgi:hypothetical protein